MQSLKFATNLSQLSKEEFKFAVVGAGPSGLAAISVLLENDLYPILWVDRSFNGGRMPLYRNVPSNTKAKIFTRFVTDSKIYSKFVEMDPNPLESLKDVPPEETCQLQKALTMLNRLTYHLNTKYQDKVVMVKDDVTSLHRVPQGPNEDVWQVGLKSDSVQLNVEKVVLATGGHPIQPHISKIVKKKLPKEPKTVDLDVALDKYKLAEEIGEEDTVAIIGASHSAMVVLLNLDQMEKKPKMIHVFYRHPLKYAVFYEDWILYDNTGLKGLAAKWAKEKFETDQVPNLKRHYIPDDNQALYEEILPQCTKIIYAVGYERDPVPQISITDQSGKKIEFKDNEIQYDVKAGKLGIVKDGKLEPLGGLYGMGIAFPEQVVDKAGNVEFAVGYFKFLNTAKRHAEHYKAREKMFKPSL